VTDDRGSDPRRPESRVQMGVRAILIAVWIFALGLASLVTAYEWSRWKDVPDASREFMVHVGGGAGIVVLIGAAPIVYRRARPADVRRTWRAWLLAVPIIVVLVLGVLLLLARGMRGTITG
jgi:uncharacterized membrane protein